MVKIIDDVRHMKLNWLTVLISPEWNYMYLIMYSHICLLLLNMIPLFDNYCDIQVSVDCILILQFHVLTVWGPVVPVCLLSVCCKYKLWLPVSKLWNVGWKTDIHTYFPAWDPTNANCLVSRILNICALVLSWYNKSDDRKCILWK